MVDISGAFDNESGTFLVPAQGVYEFSFVGLFNIDACTIQVRKNDNTEMQFWADNIFGKDGDDSDALMSLTWILN